jgi:hypothetical protein
MLWFSFFISTLFDCRESGCKMMYSSLNMLVRLNLTNVLGVTVTVVRRGPGFEVGTVKQITAINVTEYNSLKLETACYRVFRVLYAISPVACPVLARRLAGCPSFGAPSGGAFLHKLQPTVHIFVAVSPSRIRYEPGIWISLSDRPTRRRNTIATS